MPVASGPLTRSRASFLVLSGLVPPVVMEWKVPGGTSLDACLAPESDPVMTWSVGSLLRPELELLLLIGDGVTKEVLLDDGSCTYNDRLPCRLKPATIIAYYVWTDAGFQNKASCIPRRTTCRLLWRFGD